MSEKILKSRIVHKHDVAANWALATNFSPLKGEIIVYDPDENNEQPRVKVGDGETNVNDLPFVTDISKPTDLVANITNTNGVYSCDVSFADLWAANEEGRDVIFNNCGYHNVKGEFHYINTANGKVKQIWIKTFSTTTYNTYVIAEDDTITYTNANLLNKNALQQETGTGKYAIMSQKATTEALALKADQTALDAVSALVGDTAVSEQIEEAIGEIPQADWNQSDETAKDYVKNRTHYTEMCRETILPETSLEFTKAGYSGLINVGTFNLVQGESYVVTWDGQEYLCPCYSYSGEAIGDTAILSGTTEDFATEAPFMIWHTGNAMAKETGVHTFKIETLSEEVEVIHKLDEKYLPDSIKVHDWNALENRPFYEEECVLLDEEATVVANSTRVDFNDNAYVLAEGCEYKVIFNGEETYTTAFYEDTDSAIRLMCEFGSLTHDIYYRPDVSTKNCWMWVDPTLEHGVYSLKIIDTSNYIIKKIDEKYLPDSVKTQPMSITEIDAICTMDDVTALVIAEYLAEATDNEGNALTDNENNTYVF